MQIGLCESSRNCQTMARKGMLYIYLFGLWCLQPGTALRITSLDVPKTAWDAVKLNCKYELEGGTLYAVKWYKDGTEFFRCLADGTVQQFPLQEIRIFHTGRSQLGSCVFELTALTTRSGGLYTCEVGLDWPTFQTVAKSATLQVIEPARVVQTDQGEEEDDLSVVDRGSSVGASLVGMLLGFVIFMFY